VAAGKAMNGDFGSVSLLNQEQLRGLVSSNSEPLRLFQIGLTRECRAPTDVFITNFGIMSVELPALKRVSGLLAAQGKLAEMENRPADAAHSYAQAIELGDRMSHGGILINRMVGIACEAIGMNPMPKLIPALNCEQVRSVIAELERINSNRVDWQGIIQAEHRFARSELRHPSNLIPFVTSWWANRAVIRHTEQRNSRTTAQLRLLTVELALHCYLSEQGRAPSKLDQLVPKYLAQVPGDPFSQRPLVFRPQGTNWLLYSVGPDGVDDGGKSVSKVLGVAVPKGDILLSSPW
jgi:hypothetical protein